jgi:hypothetical protein
MTQAELQRRAINPAVTKAVTKTSLRLGVAGVVLAVVQILLALALQYWHPFGR